MGFLLLVSHLSEWLCLDARPVWLTWTEKIFMLPIWVTAEQCSGYKGMMGGGQLSVTNDHNLDEMQRVLSEHPASEWKTVVKHYRLLGLLIPFRAFGDMKFKWSGELLNLIYEARPELLIGNKNAAAGLPHITLPHSRSRNYISQIATTGQILDSSY